MRQQENPSCVFAWVEFIKKEYSQFLELKTVKLAVYLYNIDNFKFTVN